MFCVLCFLVLFVSSFVMITYLMGARWSCRCRGTSSGWGAIS